MSIELPCSVEEQLRDLATRQGRDIDVLVEEAIREYLEAAAITDLEPREVAQTQVALVGELQGISEWKGSE
jgi:predicted DNA-binding protein